MQNEEEFEAEISSLAKALSELHEQAVAAYIPLVNDICNRKALKGSLK